MDQGLPDFESEQDAQIDLFTTRFEIIVLTDERNRFGRPDLPQEEINTKVFALEFHEFLVEEWLFNKTGETIYRDHKWM